MTEHEASSWDHGRRPGPPAAPYATGNTYGANLPTPSGLTPPNQVPMVTPGHRPFPDAIRKQTQRGIEAVRRAETNPLAVVALMLAAAGVATFILAPIGAVLGHFAGQQIRRKGQQGANFARWAVIVGWSITGLYVVTIVLTVLVLLVQGTYYLVQLYDWAT